MNDARLNEIFGEALDLSAEARAAYLEAACGGDPGLRDRIQRLLAAAEKNDVFLGGLTRAGRDGPDAAALGEREGDVVGPYRLVRRIGEGGFGSVFLAAQQWPVRREVAFKIIKLGMDTRQVIARFEAERQALAMMDHPSIARVFDAGATELGRPYFVMELVHGESICQYCRNHSLPTRERLELFGAVCRGVQHAHTKGVIHRDLKPANVLVTVVDGRPVPKIIDFGIAKATSGRLTDRTQVTEFRQFVGTPAYMSPEQAGAGDDIDTRTDIYSLGVLLYELLTGVPPFDPQRLRSAAWNEVQKIIREEDPPRPSTRISAAAEPSASEPEYQRRSAVAMRGDLDWIVMRCLEKDRARRYETAEALAADLERHLSGQPVTAVPPSAAYRIQKFVRRNRLAVLTGGLTAAALVIGLGAALWQASVAANERDAAKESAKAALDAKREADDRQRETEQIAEFQAAQLSGLDAGLMGKRLRDDLLVTARAGMQQASVPTADLDGRIQELTRLLDSVNFTDVALRALEQNIFDAALKTVSDDLTDQPRVQARLLQTLADTLLRLGLVDRAEGPQSDALAIRTRVLGRDDPTTLESLNSTGDLRLTQGRYADASACYHGAVEGRKRVLGKDHRETLSSTHNLGLSLHLQGKRREAELHLRDLLDRSRRSLGPDDPDTLQVMNTMGGLQVDAGNPATGEPYFRDVHEGRRRVLGADHEDTLLALNNLGFAIERQDRPADAEPLYREALERSRRVMGEEHPRTLLYRSNLGFLLCTLGKMAEAELLTRGALECRRRTLGESHTDTLQSVHNTGVLEVARGNLPGAEALLREALSGRESQLGPEHPLAWQSREALCDVLVRQGRFAESEGELLKLEGGLGEAASRELCAKNLVTLYEVWAKAEPGQGHDERAARWRTQLQESRAGLNAGR